MSCKWPFMFREMCFPTVLWLVFLCGSQYNFIERRYLDSCFIPRAADSFPKCFGISLVLLQFPFQPTKSPVCPSVVAMLLLWRLCCVPLLNEHHRVHVDCNFIKIWQCPPLFLTLLRDYIMGYHFAQHFRIATNSLSSGYNIFCFILGLCIFVVLATQRGHIVIWYGHNNPIWRNLGGESESSSPTAGKLKVF